MKAIKYIIICLSALTITTSCDDFLNITPDGQVKRDPQLSYPEGIEDALYGAYSQLRSTSLYGQELHFSTLELLANDLWCKDNDATDAMCSYNYADSRVQDVFEAMWTEMYKNISNVNSILDAPLVKNADKDDYPYNIYKGEALGLRAFMHFDLVRLFAEQITVNPDAAGIPYQKEFSLNTPTFESLQKNYEHILDDLLTAETMLANEGEYVNTTNFMKDRQIHINLYAVKALLARVYFTMGNYTEALKYAKDVIENSGRTLTTKTKVNGDLAGVLSSTESLFGVYFSGFYTQAHAKLYLTTSYYSYDLREGFMDIFEENLVGQDYRTISYFTYVEYGKEQKPRLSKLVDPYELNNNVSSRPAELILGINMIRLPEMYYIVSEILLESDYDKALYYFDEVIKNRGLDPFSSRSTNNTLTQEVLNKERFKEYLGEGQTFFNMKRQNLPIVSYDGKTTYQPSKEMYVVPVPDIESENRN
ncbi:MAG: RagB/SusD family nutrient uptake outer membrane protein [Bacteroidaceae bacterium]|nr:RagB/SusD family nutrient uptake outer membrane protein [Bacteroidaceae bacterium]